MKLPKRFALSTLMLAMLVAAVVFGCAQWRRLRLFAEIAELNQQGSVTFQPPNHHGIRVRTFNELRLEGDFWPSVHPKKVFVTLNKSSDSEYYLDNKKRSAKSAKAYLKELQARLHAIGVDQVEITTLEARGAGYWPTRIENLDSL
jgi:hypothetical protein